ncbi:MAG: glycoside hydrolase family 127 protein [Phycisphaerae bacterium]
MACQVISPHRIEIAAFRGASGRSFQLVVFIATAGLSFAQPLTPIPFTDVSITDSVLAPHQKTARQTTAFHILQQCQENGRIRNFARAAGRDSTPFEGRFYDDSDVYKFIEGASYALSFESDGKLVAAMDELIELIAAAQQKDGYINTYYTVAEPGKRWTNLKDKHELYCGGHLIEAGVAHFQCTHKRTLLDVAIRFADHVDATFGPDKRKDVCGHPEIELALFRLADAVNEPRYRKMAEFFLAQRGVHDGRSSYGAYCQDHLPIADQREMTGHAVRAMYLYSAATDATIRGAGNYRDALTAMWDDLTQRRMYVTGGIGSSGSNEGFGAPFDLPNDTAYCETCASIGLMLWAHRMHLLTGEGRYIDVLERALYNNVLAGVSLDGESFHYDNPLASRGKHRRQPWFSTACCPPNELRAILSAGNYVYSVGKDAIYVNLYLPGEAHTRLQDTPITIRQIGNLPWDTEVRVYIQPQQPIGKFDVYFRMPAWCAAPQVRVNGSEVRTAEKAGGYLRIRRDWRRGEEVAIFLPMRVQRVEAAPRVAADAGRVALQRGPVFFCLEGVDNGGRVRSLALPRDAQLTAEYRKDLLGGVAVINGSAVEPNAEDWGGRLYRFAPAARSRPFLAIPYFAWNNRDAGEMVVWLPESPALCEQPAPAGVRGSASQCWRSDSVEAVFDGVEPARSGDQGIPRFTWWPKRGTREWIQVDFATPRRIAGVEVYWFDDSDEGGGCKPPASWSLAARMGGDWRAAAPKETPGVNADQFNRITFEPVMVEGLRIDAQLQEEASAGILEWRWIEP